MFLSGNVYLTKAYNHVSEHGFEVDNIKVHEIRITLKVLIKIKNFMNKKVPEMFIHIEIRSLKIDNHILHQQRGFWLTCFPFLFQASYRKNVNLRLTSAATLSC